MNVLEKAIEEFEKAQDEIKMLKAIMEAIMILVMMFTGCTASGGENGGDLVKNDIENRMDPVAIPGLRVGDRYYSINLENNSSAEAFLEKIKKNPLTVDMQDYGGFEKVGDLPWSLPTNDEKITTKPGDIILYQGNISRDLKKRGFKYLGTVTIYSHLQACGIINDHGSDCPCYKKIVGSYPTVKKNRDKEKSIGYYGG